MPSERLPMRQVRKVIRLRYACGQSGRRIAVAVGISRYTVAEYLRRAAVISLTWPVLPEIDDAAWERKLFTPPGFIAPRSFGRSRTGHVSTRTCVALASRCFCSEKNIGPDSRRATATAGSAICIPLGGAPVIHHAPEPSARRAAVRRLCRADGRGHRHDHRRAARGVRLRRRTGRVEPGLCESPPEPGLADWLAATSTRSPFFACRARWCATISRMV